MELKNNLLALLRSLRLSGLMETLEVRNRQAIEQKLSHVEFLTMLAQDEVERRGQNKLRLRLKRANFDSTKTLEGFDFSFNPSLNQGQVFDLAAGHWLERRENCLIYGPTGVGKTHLAQALAHEACRKGYEVLFVSTAKMLRHLAGGRADDSRAQRLQRYLRPDLLVLDDFGLLKVSAPGHEDLYEIVDGRYEKGSILLTSNRDRSEWSQVFGEALLASAALDRLTDRAHQVEITGDSFRVRGRTRAKGPTTTKAEGKSESSTSKRGVKS